MNWTEGFSVILGLLRAKSEMQTFFQQAECRDSLGDLWVHLKIILKHNLKMQHMEVGAGLT